MLYLVGGASRAGKSLLAGVLLARRGIPYFSLDVLMMGLYRGLPAFGLDPETPSIVLGDKMWPIVRAMAVNLLEESAVHPRYLLEGVQLLPQHASELVTAYPGLVRACFLGYTDLAPDRKLAELRRREANWGDYMTDAEALTFLAGERDYSRDLARVCAQYGLLYLDTTLDRSSGRPPGIGSCRGRRSIPNWPPAPAGGSPHPKR